MSSISMLTFVTAAALAGGAGLLIALEIGRVRARRLVFAALMKPQTVEKAWVSPPDAEGLRRLFVKAVGAPRPRTVAVDFEVDEVVRRFALAGIRIGYEQDDTPG